MIVGEVPAQGSNIMEIPEAAVSNVELDVTIVALVAFLPATVIARLSVHGSLQNATDVGEHACPLDAL